MGACQELRGSATAKRRRDGLQPPSLLPAATILGQIPQWSCSVLAPAASPGQAASGPPQAGAGGGGMVPGLYLPLALLPAGSWPALASERGSWKAKLQRAVRDRADREPTVGPDGGNGKGMGKK